MTEIGQRLLLVPNPLRRLMVRGIAGAAVWTISLRPNAAQADRQGTASHDVSIPLNPAANGGENAVAVGTAPAKS